MNLGAEAVIHAVDGLEGVELKHAGLNHRRGCVYKHEDDFSLTKCPPSLKFTNLQNFGTNQLTKFPHQTSCIPQIYKISAQND